MVYNEEKVEEVHRARMGISVAEQLFSTGEFAKRANVTVRTIHYYEKKGLIRPEKISEKGYRYYGQQEFARLQRILTLKLLGFSLEEIQEFSLNENDRDFLQRSFGMQLSLVRKKIEHLKAVEESIQNVSEMFAEEDVPDWDEITKLIRIINMDRDLVEQYQNGKNIDARITLHSRCSRNPQSWFSWIYEQMNLASGMKVLELGCGSGMLWKENQKKIPDGCEILLTDISTGMLEDTKKNLSGAGPKRFSYEVMDCCDIRGAGKTFDMVVANFLLFYLRDIKKAAAGIARVLRPGGTFICATYGEHHMQEVEKLVKEFNPKIRLSAVRLYENFGLENGEALLSQYFDRVEKREYPDELRVTDIDLLANYIMSCHGNQREYLIPEYDEFKAFLRGKLKKKGYIRITKQAGLFVAGSTEREK